jgi:hypothetical protein
MERATPVPLEAGEALIFDTTILHGSRVNTTGRLRPVAASLCIPKGASIVFHRLDQASGGARFERFDMEQDGFVEHTAQDFYGGSIRRRSLGFVKNRNRAVSLAKFEQLMANGESVRKRVYRDRGLRAALPAWIRLLAGSEQAPSA